MCSFEFNAPRGELHLSSYLTAHCSEKYDLYCIVVGFPEQCAIWDEFLILCSQRVVVKWISRGIFADLQYMVDSGFLNVGQNRRGLDTRECPRL